MQPDVFWKKELIFEKDNIKIELDEFKLKYYENGNLLSESKKNYYSDAKVIYDEKREKYYILDTEGSCIDVYSKEFKFKESHGHKNYYSDFFKTSKIKNFYNVNFKTTLKTLVLFYPLDFFIKNDYLYVWDYRNSRIVKIDLDRFIENSFYPLKNDLKDLSFTDKNIEIKNENEIEFLSYEFKENEVINIKNFDKEQLLKIFDYLNVKIENPEEKPENTFKKLFEREIIDIEEIRKYQKKYSDKLILNFNSKTNFSYDKFNCIKKIKLNFNIFGYCYNSNERTFLLIGKYNKEKNRVLIIMNEEGKILKRLNVDSKKIGIPHFIIYYYKNHFYVVFYDNNTFDNNRFINKIVKFDNELKMKKIISSIEYKKTNFVNFFEHNNELMIFSVKDNEYYKMDYEKDIILSNTLIPEEEKKINFYYYFINNNKIIIKKDRFNPFLNFLEVNDFLYERDFYHLYPLLKNNSYDHLWFLSRIDRKLFKFNLFERRIEREILLMPRDNFNLIEQISTDEIVIGETGGSCIYFFKC